jgi:hypothetical protein
LRPFRLDIAVQPSSVGEIAIEIAGAQRETTLAFPRLYVGRAGCDVSGWGHQDLSRCNIGLIGRALFPRCLPINA